MAKRAKPAKAPKAPRGAKGKSTGSAWWEQAEAVPRAGLPDAAKLTKKAKRLRWFVLSCVVLTPLAMLTNIVAVSGLIGDNAAPSAPFAVDKYANTKPTAIVAVRKWLASTPSPLPGGVLVGWHSATTDTQRGSATTGDPTYAVQSHRLTIADSSGNLYDAYVALGIVDGGEPTVIDTPSLMARVPGPSTYDGPAWFGFEAQGTTDEMSAAIDAWAAAYSSGDPAALRLTVGDDSAERNYMPLNGAVLSEPSILDVASVWGDTPVAEQTDNAETVLVRVQFKIDWPTLDPEASPAPTTSSFDLATVTYDLLMKKADTAAPVVVAWGGPGTGPDLKPYGNAVTSTELAAAPSTNAPVDLGADETGTTPGTTPETGTTPEAETGTETGATPGKTKKGKQQ